MANILVFGGSNIYGIWDKEGGWVQRLKSFLEKETAERAGMDRSYIRHLVYNLGVPSSNSESIAARVQSEIKRRVRPGEDNIVIFDVGKNDSMVMKSRDDFNVAPSVFKKNIAEIAGLAKIFSGKLVFLSLLPVDEAKVCPVYWNKDIFYKNEHVEKYSSMVKDLCMESGAYFVDVYSIFKSRPNWKSFFEDGLHLNQKGYRLVFEVVRDFLTDNGMVKIETGKR